MKYGINLLMWTDTLDDDALKLADMLKEIGYDAVEMPIFDFNDHDNFVRWGARLDELGMSRTASTIRTVDDDPMSSDPVIRKLGVENNKRTLDCCATAGCEVLMGPYHSALGHFSGAGATDDQWKWAVDSMRQVAEHAATANVTLAVEYLNRFECYLLTTAADGVRFCADVDHPNCRMTYDTFHANIEEQSTRGAILALKDCLAHVHISENNRGTPGHGNIRWDETFDALKEVDYDGYLVVEAFGMSLEKLAAATKIWRPMFQSEEQLARDALAFMKAEVAKRW